jgi:hypothetical protein
MFLLVTSLESVHRRWGGRIVQATACRAVIYGFNSHPQLFGIHSYAFDESAYSLALSEKFSFILFRGCIEGI